MLDQETPCGSGDTSPVLLPLPLPRPIHPPIPAPTPAAVAAAAAVVVVPHALTTACQPANALDEGWHSCTTQCAIMEGLPAVVLRNSLQSSCSTVGLKPSVKLLGNLWQQQQQRQRWPTCQKNK